MKTLCRISIVAQIVFLIFLNFSCTKDKPKFPSITTKSVTEISYTTAISGGEVTNEGGAPIVSRGVCWNTSADPTIANIMTIDSGGLGVFTSNINQLDPNTVYYVRAYATNIAGTGYGNQVTFSTSQVALPVLTTTAITSIAQITAVSGGNITAENGGAVTERGVCWGTSQNPTILNSKTADGTGTGIFTSTLIGLFGNTSYYVRAYATNIAGTVYGDQISFTTISIPTVSATSAIPFTSISALVGGDVLFDGNAPVTEFGVYYGTSANPEITGTKYPIGNGTGIFSFRLNGLNPNTIYYFRAYATNRAGTAYANEITFIIWLNKPGPQVKDIDGNTYNSIEIGTQIWMAENLKTTKYYDGTDIPLVTDGGTWASLDTHGYCWSKNDAVYKDVYGALYNWYASSTGKLCPLGWHVSTDAEWKTLTDYLEGKSIAGGKLKETGTTHWESPNTGATNESGFTALPGSWRDFWGSFHSIDPTGNWWSSSEIITTNAHSRRIYPDLSIVDRLFTDLKNGYSVRCLKDS